jgi:ribonuclease HI
MIFKGQTVWVHVDARGKPVLDSGGRAEMKYRENDSRSYRPGAANLLPASGSPPSSGSSGPPAPAARRSGSAPSSSAAGVNVWTDGACSGNPGPMGIGMVVLANGRRLERGEYLGLGTNNIAELVAIERGVEMASELILASKTPAPAAAPPIRVHTDSGYSIGVLSKGWKAKANQELIARIRRQLAAHPEVQLIKVPGHAGVPENERCDELAREAIVRRGPV